MKPTSLVTILLVACFVGSVRAQTHDKKDEIPIERCDRLPVVTMKVAGEDRRFLLDTAATTILNLKSFTSGESGQIHIYSWSGSADTSAREVFLPQVELGTHKLRDLKLPAIDLSPYRQRLWREDRRDPGRGSARPDGDDDRFEAASCRTRASR